MDLESRLINASVLIGLDRAIEILQEARAPMFRDQGPPVEDKEPPSAVILEEGGDFMLLSTDGRMWKTKRKRDLLRRAKQAGILIASAPA